jgi:hypothetical protein
MVRVVLSVDSVDPVRFREVVRAAVEAGLVVEEEMPAVGAVAGQVAEDRLSAVAAVDGVESVEREREFRVPRPDLPQ